MCLVAGLLAWHGASISTHGPYASAAEERKPAIPSASHQQSMEVGSWVKGALPVTEAVHQHYLGDQLRGERFSTLWTVGAGARTSPCQEGDDVMLVLGSRPGSVCFCS